MINIILIIALTIYCNYSYALPTSPGQCEYSNLSAKYIGKGLIHGPKSSSGNIAIGSVYVDFDYVCMPWDNKTDMRFGTYDLNRSYGSGEAYLSNTWGMVLQAIFPRTSVLNQGNNFWLKTFNQNEIGSDGLLRGSLHGPLFNLDKNGTIGGGSGGRFSAGTVRKFRIHQPFTVIFYDGVGGVWSDVFRGFYLDFDIYVYDATCSINYPTSVNVGDVSQGSSHTKSFKIALNCNDAVTASSNVITKFTKSTSANVSYIDEKKALQYTNNNGVKVDMRLVDENGSRITFDKESEYVISDPSLSSYSINYTGEFEATSDSSVGDFSFPINFEITYN